MGCKSGRACFNDQNRLFVKHNQLCKASRRKHMQGREVVNEADG